MLKSSMASSTPIRTRLARWGLFVAACGALAGCSSMGSVERWHMTDAQAPSSAAPGAAVQPVRVVFFRQPNAGDLAQQPVNLYINGQYQASLVGSTYTEQSLCPGTHRLAVQFNDVQRRHLTKTEGQPVAIGSTPMQYFRVTETAAGQAGLQSVSAQEASALSGLRQLQAHTVPRVVSNGCAKG